MYGVQEGTALQSEFLASPSIMMDQAGIDLTALASFMSFGGGTGSSLDLQRAHAWLPIGSSTSMDVLNIEHAADQDDDLVDLDMRSASQHMANIRLVFNPAITDLAATFGVSRQAIYNWIKGESEPGADNLARLTELSQVADRFSSAHIQRASALLKMKAFDGCSLLDLVAADQLTLEHIRLLISEAQAMQSAYERSGLAQEGAAPTADWKSSHSIPGATES